MAKQCKKEATCTIQCVGDTKRKHRYQVQSAEGITGSIYVPRTMDPIPDVIVLEKHRDDEKGDH